VRVALDTNILVSAFIFPGGSPESVYRSVLEGRIDAVTSVPLLAELARVLTEKFGWKPSHSDDAVAQVLEVSALVHPHERVSVIAEDADDDRVLEAALEGEADAIVSGDRHLLRLRTWRGIEVVTATSLLSRLV
jgi:uncharacterized protein